MKTTLCPLSLVVVLAGLAGCARPQPSPPPPPKVTVALPQVGTVTNWDEFPGHLEAVEMVEMRPRVSGYIESISFQDGAEVKVGHQLFVIDQRPYRADLERVQAERQRAETRLELARNDFKRVETLRGTKAVSEEEYDSRSKAVREAEAALAAARAAESTAQLNLDYTRITSPISGRIGRRLITVGNLVQGGGSMQATALATIVSVDPVYCYFDVEERSFEIYRAQAAEAGRSGPVPCELGLAGEDGFPHPGHVDFFDNRVDARTGTIRVRAVFANADRALIPGMFARVRLPAGPPTPALLIPAVAIGSDQGQKFVLVVNQDSVIEARSVKLGRQHGQMRAVTDGLTPQDRVVVNGLLMARAGVKVEVTEAPPKGLASAVEPPR